MPPVTDPRMMEAIDWLTGPQRQDSFSDQLQDFILVLDALGCSATVHMLTERFTMPDCPSGNDARVVEYLVVHVYHEQRTDSASDQLQDACKLAIAMGCYDIHSWMIQHMDLSIPISAA